jgi:hypothetical protein
VRTAQQWAVRFNLRFQRNRKPKGPPAQEAARLVAPIHFANDRDAIGARIANRKVAAEQRTRMGLTSTSARACACAGKCSAFRSKSSATGSASPSSRCRNTKTARTVSARAACSKLQTSCRCRRPSFLTALRKDAIPQVSRRVLCQNFSLRRTASPIASADRNDPDRARRIWRVSMQRCSSSSFVLTLPSDAVTLMLDRFRKRAGFNVITTNEVRSRYFQ